MSTLVPMFPSVKATIRPDATGELTVNGTSRPIEAEDITWLRGGVIARCALIAKPLNRPVRLSVADVTESYELAVHGDAFVQILGADGTVEALPAGAPRPAGDGRCWHCRRMQSLKNRYCIQCGTENPHDVEARRPNDGGARGA